MMKLRRYGLLMLCLAPLCVGAAEWNPVRHEPLSIGPEAHRLIVGFRATPANQVEHIVRTRRQVQGIRIVQASTSAADVGAWRGGPASRSRIRASSRRACTCCFCRMCSTAPMSMQRSPSCAPTRRSNLPMSMRAGTRSPGRARSTQ
jgi:hypothetical protein